MYHIPQKEERVKSGIWKVGEYDWEDKISQVGFNDLSRKGENERHDREETSRRKPGKSKDAS